MIQKLGQVAIPVKDINRAVAFYENVLEIPKLYQFGELAFFQLADTRILLSPPENETFEKASSVLYLSVLDIQLAYEKLLTQGVKFIDAPHVVAKVGSTENWMVFFTDPEDNTLALMSEVDV